MRKIVVCSALIALTLLIGAGTVRAEGYIQTNLVSDIPGMAQQTNPNLINPWGISFSTTSPFWISDQAAGDPAAGAKGVATTTVYSVPSATGGLTSSNAVLTVTIPNQGGAAPSDANGPTGQVNTSAPGITTGSSDFLLPNSGPKAAFIFANMDGSISAWGGGSASTIIPSTVIAGASFTGLAIGNSGGAAFIYAADQNSGNVYKFDSTWTLKGTLTDLSLPAGFTAFNVQNLNGVLYVTYAIPGHPLNGIVDEFSTDGTFIKRLIDDSSGANPHLQTPWGLAFAPTGWGALGGDLLVGNNDGDGTINAYKVVNNVATWAGQLMLGNGTAFHQDELWALTFGNGASAGSKDILYFDAGLPGATDGLFGALSIPEPSTAVLGLMAMGTLVVGRTWRNRRRPARF
jgi:uncharacterized protein (TIGR03118 family)